MISSTKPVNPHHKFYLHNTDYIFGGRQGHDGQQLPRGKILRRYCHAFQAPQIMPVTIAHSLANYSKAYLLRKRVSFCLSHTESASRSPP
jgi:hypothetical protein